MTEVSVRVRFFAQAREIANTRDVIICVPKTLHVNELRSIIVNKFNLSSIEKILILAINETYVCDSLEISLKENDTVAIIPPISGGMPS